MKKQTENQIKHANKMSYKSPTTQITVLSPKDMITTSGGENLGEWDPQKV